jgi:outer membrane protein TolC
MKSNQIHYILLLVLLPFTLCAQNTISIRNTLDLINQYHPIAKQADLKVDMSKAALMSVRGAFDPAFYLNNEQKTIDGKNYFYYSNPELKIPTWYGIEVKAGFENNYGDKLSAESTSGKSSYLGVSIPLLKDVLIDKRRSDLAQSKILVQLSKEERQLLLNDLYLDGASSFWQWTYAFQKQQLFSNIMSNAKNRFDFIKKSFVSGDRAAIDTVEGLLQLQNIMNLQSQAWAEQIEEQSKLSNFLWDAQQQPYELNERVIPDSSWLKIDLNKIELPSLLQVIEEASMSHPKLKALEFKTDMLQVERQYKVQNLLPTFRVNYNFLNKGYQFSNPINQSLYSNNYKAGVQFGLPLFLRQARGDLKQANLKIELQKEEIKQVKLEIENKIKKYYAELVAFKNQQVLTNISVDNARKLLDAEFQRFEIGESSLFLVNNRELKYIELLLKSYELKSKFFKTLVALNWAKGAVYQ